MVHTVTAAGAREVDMVESEVGLRDIDMPERRVVEPAWVEVVKVVKVVCCLFSFLLPGLESLLVDRLVSQLMVGPLDDRRVGEGNECEAFAVREAGKDGGVCVS